MVQKLFRGNTLDSSDETTELNLPRIRISLESFTCSDPHFLVGPFITKMKYLETRWVSFQQLMERFNAKVLHFYV